MQSAADRLPPDIASRIKPEWRKNETEYWKVRQRLLSQYRDQWIGFADGVVVASGASPVAVFHAAEESGRHPFVTCVGREDEPCRMRRSSFAYDASYPVEALPILAVEFRQVSGSAGLVLDRVIPDTGATPVLCPGPIANGSISTRRKAGQDGWAGSRAAPRPRSSFAPGRMSMGKNIHAGCKRTLSATNASWAATY